MNIIKFDFNARILFLYSYLNKVSEDSQECQLHNTKMELEIDKRTKFYVLLCDYICSAAK